MLNPMEGTYIALGVFCFIYLSRSFELGVPSSEKRLIKMLLQNYEDVGKIGRPVRNREETVVVGYGLSLFQLLDLDVTKQVLTINVWAKYTWIDQLLQWDPANYSNIREVRIPPNKIWTPDIVLYNYVDERLTELRDVMLNVDYLGRVFWSPPAIFKSNCRMVMSEFPFDYQFCHLRFASKTLFSDQMDLQFLDNRTEVDIDQYTTSNEWTLIARPARKFLMMAEQCGKTIPDLTFFLFLKRNPAYYAYLQVFPCILLSLIPVITFWFPPNTPAKMLLGQNAFSGFLLLLKFVAKSTPFRTSTIPYLLYFYSVNLIATSFATFMATIIINMQSYSRKHPEIPQWLTKTVRTLSIILRIEFPDEKHFNALSLLEVALKRKQEQDEIEIKRLQEPESRRSAQQFAIEWGPRGLPEMFGSRAARSTQARQQADRVASVEGKATIHINNSLIDLRDSLKKLMVKLAKKDAATRKARNWRLVIMTMDRIFFWFYLIVIITAGCYYLGAPGQGQNLDELLKSHAVEYTKINKKLAANCLLPWLHIPDYQKGAVDE